MDIIKKIILEGRVEDMREKYVDNEDLPPIRRIREKLFNVLVKGDPSGNQKYLDWMIQQVIRGEMLGVTPEYILNLVTQFHNKVQRLDKKDLYQYGGFNELERTINNIKPSRSEIKKIEKEGSIKLYEDDDCLVVVPTTKEGSCHYGSGTKWCTAAKRGNQFENYNEDGVLFYIIQKKPPTNNINGLDFSKIAMYVRHDIIHDYNGHINYFSHFAIEVYDATDTLLEGTLWSDHLELPENTMLKIQKVMLDYFNMKAEEMEEED